MKKKFLSLLILTIFQFFLIAKIDNSFFTDGLVKYIYSNDWIKTENSIGIDMLHSEGIGANVIFFQINKNFKNFLMYITKDITTLYFSNEGFLQNTLKRAREHYSLDKKWGYSYLINLNGNRKAAVTIGRSGTYTSNNFPSNTVGIWVEYLKPFINIKNNKAKYIFYGLSFRLPINLWGKLKNTFFQNYIFGKLLFIDDEYIETIPEVLESFKWLKKNNFKLSFQSKIVENIKPKEKKTSIEIPKKVITPEEIKNRYKFAIWFSPENRIPISSMFSKINYGIKDSILSYNLNSNSFEIFDKFVKKIKIIKIKNIKSIKTLKKIKLFKTIYSIVIDYKEMKKDKIIISRKYIEDRGGIRYLEDFVRKIKKINKILYNKNL